MSRKGRNRGIYCGHEKLYPLSPDVPGTGQQEKKGFVEWEWRCRAPEPHFICGKNPAISGKKGSGAIFFSGCTLKCVFCQNREVAEGKYGKEISSQRLTEIFLELQGKGAANINLVTAGHFVRSGEGSTFEGKGAGTCDSGNLQFGRV